MLHSSGALISLRLQSRYSAGSHGARFFVYWASALHPDQEGLSFSVTIWSSFHTHTFFYISVECQFDPLSVCIDMSTEAVHHVSLIYLVYTVHFYLTCRHGLSSDVGCRHSGSVKQFATLESSLRWELAASVADRTILLVCNIATAQALRNLCFIMPILPFCLPTIIC